MTVILILLCLAIAGRELYMAFDRRLPDAQAEIRDLRGRVDELSRGIEEPPPEDQAESAEEIHGGARPAGGPLTRRSPVSPAGRPAPRTHTAAAAVSAALIRRLERDLGETASRLATLERDLAVAREAETARARSLDSVEQTVATLYHEMIDRLEHEQGAVRGLLYADEAAIEPMLTTAYERCLAEIGLRVRAKEPAPGTPWYTGYLLSGERTEGLAARLLALASLLGPDEPTALYALLNELAELQGGGVARIGAFTAVRTQTWVTCGLLTAEPGEADPVGLAARLDDLPGTLRWDPVWFAPGG